MIKSFIPLFTVILFWFLSFVNHSGYGIAHALPTKTYWLLGILFLYTYTKDNTTNNPIKRNSKVAFLSIFSFVLLPVIFKQSWDGFQYILTAALVYFLSTLQISKSFINKACTIIGGLGAVLMLIYTRTEILLGWNDNELSMIGLFSYLFFSIFLYGNMEGRKLTIGLLATAFFIFVITSKTDSRSGAIFIILSAVFAYFPTFAKNIVQSPKFVRYGLLLPLAIALVVVFLPNLEIFQYLNAVSMDRYEKSVFNGRDELWGNALRQMPKDFFMGAMEEKINYHNSVIAVLAMYGLIGYYAWHNTFSLCLKKMQQYLSDDIVFGCMMTFMLIFWQQSFDLGFITRAPNYIPYIILGLGLGRVNTIQKYGSC